jgi:hypothetical protein
MARFRIEFEGHVPASLVDVDAALEEVRRRLAELWIAEPEAEAEIAKIQVRVSFVLDAGDPREALAGGHSLLGHAVDETRLTHVTWTAARAERTEPGG